MKITPDLLVAATSAQDALARRIATPLDRACQLFEINTPLRLASFLSQCAHESLGFTKVVESLVYTKPERLMAVWRSRFPSREFAIQYVREPEKLANYVYCNRMGNGPIASGDGWRYRGRGYLHLTGRSNYEAMSRATGMDVVENPDLLLDVDGACASAAFFWAEIGDLNGPADRGDNETVTRRLNGGLVGYEDGNDEGLDDRVERYERARRALGIA